ncbi:29474_t:CDS:1, partial [Racocetra persica]
EAPAFDLWQRFIKNYLTDNQENSNNNQQIAINLTLQQIASMLIEHRKHMHDYGLPEP